MNGRALLVVKPVVAHEHHQRIGEAAGVDVVAEEGRERRVGHPAQAPVLAAPVRIVAA